MADLTALLARRQQLTDALADAPYDLVLYLRRAAVYADLAYPDLAAGDAYRALLLTDEVADEGFEYHDVAVDALAPYLDGEAPLPEDLIPSFSSSSSSSSSSPSPQDLAARAAVGCFHLLSASLLRCGCLRSALSFCERGLAAVPAGGDHAGLRATRAAIHATHAPPPPPGDTSSSSSTASSVLLPLLPDRGSVRREIYPWNTYEPDRFSAASLAFLNAQLRQAAPKCEVRATDLPVLVAEDVAANSTTTAATGATCRQLGLFATEPIAAGEVVLREYSLLTANNRLKESMCDACSSELPPLDDATAAGVPCPDCDDTVFCNAFCRDQALARYHPAVCARAADLDAIAKDPDDPRAADDALYVLLLARLLAMAAHQDVHPLDVDEVKYIYGDFSPPPPPPPPAAADAGVPPVVSSLPFSFETNIAAPLHLLEKMDLDVFADLARYDVWVCNTLYAKFRGTASARKSRRDGRPDVAAVHPLWCLANHDCDPNVTWEWGGRMALWAREQRVPLRQPQPQPSSSGDGAAAAAATTTLLPPRPGGIAAGDEILNHYCDIDLPVQQRREWASGSLGGVCMCQRCRTEAALEAEEQANARPAEVV